MNQLYGGIEAGGTKFVCVVGTGAGEVVAESRFSTTGPEETIQQAIEFFDTYTRRGELLAVGIASFGPIDLNPASPTYGYVTTTPKPGWGGVDLHGEIQRALHIPVTFDTDVNVAALGEHYWIPENLPLDPFLYVTVGTGIGVGAFVNGHPLHGLIHAEAGHMAIPHHWEDDPFPGVCPYHGDCLEGLASGPAMARRWEAPAESLPIDHPAWTLEAEYIALALVNLIYAFSPQRIVLGGGVAQHPGLHEMIRTRVQRHLNGYLRSPMLLEKIDDYIVKPALGNRSGVFGALAMALL